MPVNSSWKFKIRFVEPTDFFWVMPSFCLSSFKSTLQNCIRRSGSSLNNPWSHLGRCIGRPKDLREMSSTIEALFFIFYFSVLVNAWATNISFSWVVTLTGRPLFDALQMDPVWSNLPRNLEIVTQVGGGVSHSSAHFCRTFSALLLLLSEKIVNKECKTIKYIKY
jgi:hypothetical protein